MDCIAALLNNTISSHVTNIVRANNSHSFLDKLYAVFKYKINLNTANSDNLHIINIIILQIEMLSYNSETGLFVKFDIKKEITLDNVNITTIAKQDINI